MALPGIGGLSADEALANIAQLIDACQAPRHTPGISRALEWCNELEATGLAPVELTALEYFRANAWNHRMPRYQHGGDAWKWEQPALREQILCLRRARYGDGFDRAPTLLRCQILTNLGNLLSSAGRAIEALEPRSEALVIEPRFWMARGNLGTGLARYARHMHSSYHAAALFLCADRELTRAITDAQLHPHFGYPEALASFEREKTWIGERVNLADLSEYLQPDDDVELGKSLAERSYRSWCLSNHLFLNPINDGMACAAAADDSLPLPDLVAKLGDPPSLQGFFNQLKQEYVSARWSYYSGTHPSRPHFSDRDVTLFNTLDSPAYGLAVEQVRTSYRIAYSLLDKVAFFLNEYLSLKIPIGQVSFGRVWRDRSGPKGVLDKRFATSKNHTLRGLYWLSKDILDPDFKDSTAPDAQALSDIRNHLEHRYLKIHEIFAITPGMQRPDPTDKFVDTMAYSVGRRDFEAKTLRLLKLVRAALFHLTLAMSFEEQRRWRARRSKRSIFGQTLPIMEQSQKV